MARFNELLSLINELNAIYSRISAMSLEVTSESVLEVTEIEQFETIGGIVYL